MNPRTDTENTELENRQREYLEKVAHWADRIQKELRQVLDDHPGQVHFRPSSGGAAMISLDPKRPQLGRSRFKDLERLHQDFNTLFRKHCVDCSPGRDTPEKALQSFLITEAYLNNRMLCSINDASKGTDDPVDLMFAMDEIPVPLDGKKRIVCDILALRVLPDGLYRPVLLELKSARMKEKLIKQVEEYAEVVDRHSDLFGKIFSALLGEIHLTGKCEKWIVWPQEGDKEDPRQQKLAEKGIRVVGYKPIFSFRVGKGVER